MAKRPAWILYNGRVCKKEFDFKWNAGQSATQKKKNVKSLHESIGKKTLEVSTKSDDELGQSLSAFNLKLNGKTFENVYQASKKYLNGGPFSDLMEMKPGDAKDDLRHTTSGPLVSFVYENQEFPINPITLFYNYLYTKAVKETIPLEKLKEILDYDYFTDIEFNPKKSINCQARGITLIKQMLIEFGEIPDFDLNSFYNYQKNTLSSFDK